MQYYGITHTNNSCVQTDPDCFFLVSSICKYDCAEEKWRTWQDDVMDYLDAMKPGMRKMLKAAEAKTGNVTEEWLANMRLPPGRGRGGW